MNLLSIYSFHHTTILMCRPQTFPSFQMLLHVHDLGLTGHRASETLGKIGGAQVRMGFGLHVGWAIEGAIGSEYKIDASYLSPNVNMASRLEAATKQFGTSILMSEDFARMLSPAVRTPRCKGMFRA